ncbi:hypothetical protein [Ornithinibacillus sp. JPR2-1]|uniref:hypothetical protein n=1 Tax=Ornithinibacillus sp. JPR2-1 TaxID=2094019 RepID=UPI0031DE7E4E
MSWKSVEMQVALPRTQDAGKLQEQMLKSNQHFQEALAQSQVKQDNQKRKKVQEFDDIQFQKDGQKGSPIPGDKKQHNQEDNTEQDPTFKHPYLGNNFDIRS